MLGGVSAAKAVVPEAIAKVAKSIPREAIFFALKLFIYSFYYRVIIPYSYIILKLAQYLV
jgi:hypothetical protein